MNRKLLPNDQWEGIKDLLPGNWHSVYRRHSPWGKKGVWKRLLEQVSDDIDLEQLLLDSTILRVHRHGAGAKKRRASGHRSLAWWIDHQDSFSG